MYRKLTYIKHEYELELVQMEEFNENDQLTYIKEINREGTLESRFKFDVNGNVTEEENLVDGVLSDKSEYIFDKEGNLLSHKFIIDNEVIEETKREVTDSTTIEKMYQNGEEVKKSISEYKEGESRGLFYEFGELVEKQITKESKEFSNSIAYSSNDEIIYFENYYYNSKDQITKHEILNPDKTINSIETYIYNNENLAKISFSSDTEKNCQRYERDKNGNVIRFEITNEDGNVVHFSNSEYDDKNRLIARVDYSNGVDTLFEIKYEEIN